LVEQYLKKVVAKRDKVRVSPEVGTAPAAPSLVLRNFTEVKLFIEVLPCGFYRFHSAS